MVLGVQTGLALPEVVVSAVRYCLSSMPFVAIEPVRLDARPLFEALGDGRVDFALASVHRGGGAACGHVAHRRGEGTVCLAAPAHSPLPDELAPRDVAKQTFLFSDGVPVGSRPALDGFLPQPRLMPKLAPCDGVSTCLTCIELGFGLGVLPAGHQAFALPGHPAHRACAGILRAHVAHMERRQPQFHSGRFRQTGGRGFVDA